MQQDASSQRAGAQQSGRDLAYKAAADRYWIASGSTAADTADLAHRRATRTSGGQPLNLTVYDLALDHEQTLAEFARAHGRPEDIPSGRTALAAYAAAIAVERPETAAEYETRRHRGRLGNGRRRRHRWRHRRVLHAAPSR